MKNMLALPSQNKWNCSQSYNYSLIQKEIIFEIRIICNDGLIKRDIYENIGCAYTKEFNEVSYYVSCIMPTLPYVHTL